MKFLHKEISQLSSCHPRYVLFLAYFHDGDWIKTFENVPLSSGGQTAPITMDSEPDPYISCTNVILDKFSNGSNKDTAPYAMSNGSPARKTSGGIKDFLLGRSSANRKDSVSSKDGATNPDLWSNQESVIDELRISTIPRQPKYSYLIGKASHKSNDDFWRKSNAVSIVNNNLYSRPERNANSGKYLRW